MFIFFSLRYKGVMFIFKCLGSLGICLKARENFCETTVKVFNIFYKEIHVLFFNRSAICWCLGSASWKCISAKIPGTPILSSTAVGIQFPCSYIWTRMYQAVASQPNQHTNFHLLLPSVLFSLVSPDGKNDSDLQMDPWRSDTMQCPWISWCSALSLRVAL